MKERGGVQINDRTSSVGDVAITDVVQAVEDEEAGHVLLFNRIAAQFETKDPFGRAQIHLDVLLPVATSQLNEIK